MAKVNLRVSGKTIKELSEKIPSNIFALIELIKNSYDAFSSKVDIKIDSSTSKLTITDDGFGMNLSDIKKLLYIGESEKKYGKKVTRNGIERYVQGSKGLGFLSVFKFGDSVEWSTSKDGINYLFYINKKDLIGRKNLTGFSLSPVETPTSKTGTMITVNMDRFALDTLNKYFSLKMNAEKTVNSFYDDSFKIKLDAITGITSSGNQFDFTKAVPEFQLCYVTFSSKDRKIFFYYDGKIIKEEPFEISNGQYILDADIMFYSLPSYGTRKIPYLYHRDDGRGINPLIFINNSLFNNTRFFDSNINRGSKTGESMAQMIGAVRVYCSSPELEFNSDRTNFVESQLTTDLISDLDRLNKKIQKIASEIRNDKKDANGVVITLPAAPLHDNSDEAAQQTQQVTTNHKRASIDVKSKINEFTIPSPQIDINSLIHRAYDSSGNKIPVESIQVFVDGEVHNSNIIESISEECVKVLKLIFNDPNTGKVIEEVILSFKKPTASVQGINKKKNLFPLEANKIYTITLPHVTNLINQINSVYEIDNDGYYEIISCSLRAIFEVSVSLINSRHPIIMTHIKPAGNGRITGDPLTWGVLQIIHFVKSNEKLRTFVSKNTKIGFHTLNNLLDIESYCSVVKKCHLGAHNATIFIDPSQITFMAMKAGHFAVIADVIYNALDDNMIKSYAINAIEDIPSHW